MNTPLISVIMPVYNRETLVARAVESVFAQTYRHWELLVVDDGSTDRTLSVLESFGSRITRLSQPHAGDYRARNLALQHARGDFVAFIDSDDVWYPRRLEAQMPLFEKSTVGLVFGDAVLVDYHSEPPRRRRRTFFDNAPPARGRAPRQFAVCNFVPLGSVLARRRCFDELGGFSITAPLVADFIKWIDISLHYDLDYVREPVFEYALHDGNQSSDLLQLALARVRLLEELMDATASKEANSYLRHILLNAHLHLALTCARRSIADVTRILARPSPRLQPIPLHLRCAWLADYVAQRIRARLR